MLNTNSNVDVNVVIFDLKSTIHLVEDEVNVVKVGGVYETVFNKNQEEDLWIV
jgi:hypothetical protein